MGYGTLDRIPDQLLGEDDKYALKIGIEWFLRLLDKNIALTERAFEFCLFALNERAPEFIAMARSLVAQHGVMKLAPETVQGLLNSFDDNLEDYDVLADHLGTFVQKCGAALGSSLAKAIRQTMAARLYDLGEGQETNIEQRRQTLKALFSLDDMEADVATGVYLLENWDIFAGYFNTHLECRERGKTKIFSTMLGFSHRDFHTALSGKLSSLDLVYWIGTELCCVGVVSTIFTSPREGLEGLFYKDLKKEILPLNYFPLGEGVVEHVLALLQLENRSPTHILLYGAPGAGKTSFAAAVGHALGQSTFYVRTPNDGDLCMRKKALAACLNVTSNGQDALVVVDEADTFLNTETQYFSKDNGQDKGWLNEFCERPGIRIVWITNDISGIPDSVMRRFAYSVEFPELGLDQRINIWNRVAQKNKVVSFLSQEKIKSLAISFPLSAGSIDLAVKKSREIAGRKKRLFVQAVERSLKASQQLISGTSAINKDDAIESNYSLEGLNLDADTPNLLRQLGAFNAHLDNVQNELRVNMNLLFYGPPGTGKTEMSRYLARHLKRELTVRRTSDLLSKWVGESEQQIASAFREAEKKRAVLVIDEADSLLFRRDKAQRSWETSMVNEFLTQMEHFRGLLICTTNRLEELDAASLRRFNHKIRFDFLTHEGNRLFYERMLQPLVSSHPSEAQLGSLGHLNNLTPGDFKIVRDRFVFYPKKEMRHEDLVKALSRESELKHSASQGRIIGF
jgi:SpoVK/Ycf46/Vps4 family AAA+-type ATPase